MARERRLEAGDGGPGVAQLVLHGAQHGEQAGVRLARRGRLEQRQRLLAPAGPAQRLAQVGAGVEEIGVELKGATVTGQGFLGPAGPGRQQAPGVVRRGQSGIAFKGPGDSGLGLRQGAGVKQRQRQRVRDLGLGRERRRAPQVAHRLGAAPGQAAERAELVQKLGIVADVQSGEKLDGAAIVTGHGEHAGQGLARRPVVGQQRQQAP